MSNRPRPTVQAAQELRKYTPLPVPRIVEGDPLLELLTQALRSGGIESVEGVVTVRGGQQIEFNISTSCGKVIVEAHTGPVRLAMRVSASARDAIAHVVQVML